MGFAWVYLVLALAAAEPAHAPTSQIEALATEPEVRWSFGPLAFESEPALAYGTEGWRVIASGRDATGRRALVVLDAEDGRVLSRTLLAAKEPLAVRAAGERVAVRSAPNRVDLYRLRGARLLVERSFTATDSISAPALDERAAVLREDGELVHYALERREPLWRARVPGAFCGAPAVLGEHVFGVWYDANETAHLAWLAGASGELRGDLPLGRHRPGSKPEPQAPRVVAHESVLFVQLFPGLPATNGQDLEWARVPFDGQRFCGTTLHAFLAAPLETPTGWVAPERESEGQTRWLQATRATMSGGSDTVIELASSAHHAWLAANSVAASRAGNVLYLGPCAADAHTQAVLWRRARGSDFAPVPLPGRLLVVEGDRLHCLGSPARPLDDATARARALADSEDRALGERLLQIATRALRGGEGELAKTLLSEAEGSGAEGRTLELVRAEVERARPVPPRTGTRRSPLAAEAEVARAAWFERLAKAAEPAAPALQRALLCELFQRDPGCAAGLRLLARRLPPFVAAGADTSRAWLEWLALGERRAVAILDGAASDGRPSQEEQALAEERGHWRADLAGYQSERLLVLSAGTAPDAVARTLRTGELVCDVLESTFGSGRPSAPRLVLVLYPTREEYLAHSGSDLGGLEHVLGFTAGHFDLSARVSRLFQPEGDVCDARLMNVSAHELTHHWLALRGPFGELRATAEQPGFWIVEAIATWAEELELELENETWTSAPRRSASLDTLVHADARDLLRWKDVLAAGFADFQKVETRPTCQLSLDWQLGSRAPRSPMQFFYAQGGALAHFLYEGAGPAGRALLTRIVEAYYRGAPLDVARELGLTPDELGARVLAWAQETMAR
jgi:hypothetical protein